MTLIAIACRGDRAEFITDTLSYSGGLRHLALSTKSVNIPHLDAAIIGQGDSEFTYQAEILLLKAAGIVASFDELIEAAPLCLQDIAGALHAATLEHLTESTIFLVGYSTKRKKFDAYLMASEDGFQARRISGLHVMPAPFSAKPSKLELDRLIRRSLDGEEVLETELERLFKQWRSQPRTPAPSGIKDWLRLAFTARTERSLQPFLRTPVDGKVFLTRLSRGSSETVLIVEEFDPTGEDFQLMVAGTLHPSAQLGPCPCPDGPEGLTLLECCLVPHLDQPCECGSSRNLRDCCMIQPDEARE